MARRIASPKNACQQLDHGIRSEPAPLRVITPLADDARPTETSRLDFLMGWFAYAAALDGSTRSEVERENVKAAEWRSHGTNRQSARVRRIWAAMLASVQNGRPSGPQLAASRACRATMPTCPEFEDLSMCIMIKATVGAMLLGSTISAFAEEALTCNSEKVFRGGASKGSDLLLKLESGRVTFLATNTFTSSGKEGGGYMCSMDSSRQGSKVKWSGADTQTLTISDETSGEESILKISRLARGYKVTFEKAWSGYCGFGAEFPTSITLTRGSKKCVVVE